MVPVVGNLVHLLSAYFYQCMSHSMWRLDSPGSHLLLTFLAAVKDGCGDGKRVHPVFLGNPEISQSQEVFSQLISKVATILSASTPQFSRCHVL
jgi:hypothetical protein